MTWKIHVGFGFLTGEVPGQTSDMNPDSTVYMASASCGPFRVTSLLPRTFGRWRQMLWVLFFQAWTLSPSRSQSSCEGASQSTQVSSSLICYLTIEAIGPVFNFHSTLDSFASLGSVSTYETRFHLSRWEHRALENLNLHAWRPCANQCDRKECLRIHLWWLLQLSAV